MRALIKALPYLLIVGLVLYAPVRESLSSAIQSVVIHTGVINTSVDSIKTKEKFDYGFSVKNLAGELVEFKSFRKKVIFLNLWATWCGPCRSEMPSIQELYNGLDKEKISFVMLSLDDPAYIRRVKAYVDKSQYTFPVYINEGRLPGQLEVPSIPTTFIIDLDGTIVHKEVGMHNYNTTKFKKYLEGLAAK